MKRAKHDNKKMERVILVIVMLMILVALFFIIFIISPRNGKKPKSDNVTKNLIEEPIAEPEPEPEPEKFEMVDTSDLPDTIAGYQVLGKIVLEKIGIEQKILYASQEQQDDALNNGVAWFYGPSVNEPRKFVYNRS